jgi:hypothetical protein
VCVKEHEYRHSVCVGGGDLSWVCGCELQGPHRWEGGLGGGLRGVLEVVYIAAVAMRECVGEGLVCWECKAVWSLALSVALSA